MSVTALHTQPSTMSAAAHLVNTLWFRLNQAQAVAQCIPDKCNIVGTEGAADALAQAMALSGAVAELLALALSDMEALEALV